ncbi:MAG: crotonobetainyl-CoA:carnitine CoA-transferase CaiB-like acyl-CoA transferase, partial [Myxococcota bacterium]
VAIDLKSPTGQEAMRALIQRSDVLVENFRPGVLERLGFGVEAARALNPRLIYASISGFGNEGLPEFVASPGYDLLAQSLSGVASLTGPADASPSKAGISIGDLVGGLYAVQGIMAALYERERTGLGKRVDISMLDGLVSLLTYQASAWLVGGKPPGRLGNQHPSICPFETLRTSDGHLSVCCGNDKQFAALATALERPELLEDERFGSNSSRVQHRPILIPILEAVLAAHPSATWLPLLTEAGVPCAQICDVPTALEHPQLAARGMIGEVDHPTAGTIKAIATPIRLDGVAAFTPVPSPTLGQHTTEILEELGLDPS